MPLSWPNSRTKKADKPEYELPSLSRSLCPVCLKVIDAKLYQRQNQVFMSKTCAEHGSFNELISSDAEFFKKMRRTDYNRPVAPANPHCKNTLGCPNACGFCERHLSTPVMVNIDLTNRCNLNCPICFANSNAAGRLCELTLEQLDRMLDAAADIGPERPSCLQLTGGEPTLHKDFIEALRHIKSRGFTQIQVATNGLRFAQSFEFCQAASEAGLNQVYLQFDGLSDDIYIKTRGRALLQTKFKAVDNIKRANMRIVLVPTLVKGLNDHQVGDITRFAVSDTDAMSAVSFQPVAITGRIDESARRQMRYTTADLARDLQQQLGFIDMYRDWFPFSTVEPFARLMEVTTKQPHMHFGCHPHCGCATYLVVDKQTNTAMPLPVLIDVEAAMKALDKIAARIERLWWSRDLSILQMMNALKKHFHADKAPKGWGFDDFLGFVKSLIEFAQQHADNAAYIGRLRGQRFGTLLVASMHFQDNYNYEIDRCRRCLIFYVAPDGRFYPFCTWNSGPCHRYRIERRFSRPVRRIRQVCRQPAVAAVSSWPEDMTQVK